MKNIKFFLSKGFLILLTSGFLILLTSCSNVNNNDTINKNDEAVQATSYRVTDERYNNKQITISYPQIIMGQDDKQKTINDILKSEALVVLGLYENSKDVFIDVNYKIMSQNENAFSVQYSGIANAKGAAYPLRLFYTTNININDGGKIRLRDIVKIDKEFVNKIKNYKMKDVDINHASTSAFDYIVNTYSLDDLIRYFEGADSSYEYSAFTFSYLTKDAIGISIEVPHAVGDYLQIELKYEDIKDSIRIDNEISKGLLY